MSPRGKVAKGQRFANLCPFLESRSVDFHGFSSKLAGFRKLVEAKDLPARHRGKLSFEGLCGLENMTQ